MPPARHNPFRPRMNCSWSSFLSAPELIRDRARSTSCAAAYRSMRLDPAPTLLACCELATVFAVEPAFSARLPVSFLAPAPNKESELVAVSVVVAATSWVDGAMLSAAVAGGGDASGATKTNGSPSARRPRRWRPSASSAWSSRSSALALAFGGGASSGSGAAAAGSSSDGGVACSSIAALSFEVASAMARLSPAAVAAGSEIEGSGDGESPLACEPRVASFTSAASVLRVGHWQRTLAYRHCPASAVTAVARASASSRRRSDRRPALESASPKSRCSSRSARWERPAPEAC